MCPSLKVRSATVLPTSRSSMPSMICTEKQLLKNPLTPVDHHSVLGNTSSR